MSFNPYDSSKADQIEHDRVVHDLQSLMSHPTGKSFIKYLFKNFGVGEYPAVGLTGEVLHDYMGYLRAGQSIFDLASQADPVIAAALLAELQKEKYNVQKA